VGDFEAINQELTLFKPGLADTPQLVVLNKLDLPDAQAHWPTVAVMAARYDLPVHAISAVTGEGVVELLRRAQMMLDALPALEAVPEPLIELAPAPDRKAFTITAVEEGVWLVEGAEIEKVVKMTNWDYYESGMRFQRVLNALGIRQALIEAGVEEGDTVRIGAIELVWGYENALGE